VTIISPSVRTHAGWDSEDIIGNPVTDFYKDPSERETFKEKLKKSGVINDYELRLLAKDGRVIDVSVSSKIISSLLNLQSRHIEDYKVKDMFKMSRDRIRSMALIHEKLYQSEDLAKINFAQYIRSLAVHLMNTYNASVDRIKLDAEVTDVFLDINKAIPCGLIVNELVSNSLKHAFPSEKVEISISNSPRKIMGLYVLRYEMTGSDLQNR
jgi:PAS domain-containing protein